MDLFTPDKDLLNPKFEGYRLDRIPQDDAIARYTLQHKPTQATVSGKIPLSFQEVQSRITHNHLAVSSDAGCAVYVDADYKVILINLGADRATPTFRVIHELPTPISYFQRDFATRISLNRFPERDIYYRRRRLWLIVHF
ncbi:hypothetical protein BDQ17DRAFT_1440949 [Cyathus striatus]|nr:hypothetical protein BDQ17DRAFT_1440949 [Cyathus striatus]